MPQIDLDSEWAHYGHWQKRVRSISTDMVFRIKLQPETHVHSIGMYPSLSLSDSTHVENENEWSRFFSLHQSKSGTPSRHIGILLGTCET